MKARIGMPRVSGRMPLAQAIAKGLGQVVEAMAPHLPGIVAAKQTVGDLEAEIVVSQPGGARVLVTLRVARAPDGPDGLADATAAGSA